MVGKGICSLKANILEWAPVCGSLPLYDAILLVGTNCQILRLRSCPPMAIILFLMIVICYFYGYWLASCN